MEFDVFISHASEDKATIARPLRDALEAAGVRAWLDELNISWGESLSAAIDAGLAKSRYGIVILSQAFFKKAWTQRELDGLVQRQVGERRVVILPIYHDVTNEDVREYSPTLASALAVQASIGIPKIVEKVLELLARAGTPASTSATPITSPGVASPSDDSLNRAKSYMAEKRFVGLEDLIQEETTKSLQVLSGEEFDANFDAGDADSYFAEFHRRITAYDAAIEDLSAVLAAVAYFGTEDTHVALRRALEKLGDHPNDLDKSSSGGRQIWTNLKRYPAVIAFHKVAAAAIAAERWQNLRPLLREARVSRAPLDSRREPMLLHVRPYDPFQGRDQGLWLARTSLADTTRKYTPEEDHICSRVVATLARFGLHTDEAERVFDTWTFLAQISYLDIPQEDGRWDDYFSVGRWWRVPNLARSWEASPQGQLMSRVQAEGSSSPVLRSGAGRDNAAHFHDNALRAKEMVQRAISKQGH